MNQRDIGKQAVVEFIGPFALVFAGVGAIIATRGENLVAIALAHGLAIGLMITAVGHISGGHFNPAVTIAMLATGRIEAARAGVYVVAQILGATAAAGVLTAVYPDLGDLGRNVAGINNGVPAISPGIGVFSATLLEVVLTFFLVFVIFGVAVDPRTPKVIAGLAIGLTITMDIFAGGVLSGAVMNPARALGPAIVQQDFTNAWVWIVGPVIGGLIAAFLYQTVLLSGVREEPVADRVAASGAPAPVVAKAPAAAPKRRTSRR